MDPLIFRGQNAFILAASKGIGFGIAKALFRAGANIFINSNNNENLENAIKELSTFKNIEDQVIRLAKFDINNTDDANAGIKQVIDWSKNKIDILVTNSVNFGYGPFLELTEKDWELAVLYKFTVVERITNAIIPYMIRNKYGCIVNIGSVESKEPQFGFSPATCMRLAVSGYLKSLADHTAASGVRINQVLCGYVMTETVDKYLDKKAETASKNKDELKSEITNKIPMKRFANPDEIGQVVKFLCSNDASYITGQSVVVDGGLMRSIT